MPPFYRIMEVAVYSLVNFLPFLVLALYPFRNNMRFSRNVTAVLVFIMTLIQITLGVWAGFFSGGHLAIISAVSTLLYAVFYFIAVKMPFGKTLFTLLMMSNIDNLIVVSSKCIEGQIWYSLALQSYRWSFSLIMICIEIVILVPIFFYIKNTFTPAVEKEPSGVEWNYLWLIPATFYLVWYYGIYGNASRSSLQIALRPSNAIFFFFINSGAFLIYYIVAKLVKEQNKNIELQVKNHQLAMQSLQYENLQDKIAEAKRARHDVRHHITLMQNYLNNQKYDELKEYLNDYQNAQPCDRITSYCDNPYVNTLLSYFAQIAYENDIDYVVKASIESHIGVTETDLSVLFGNLLENAIDACKSVNNKSRKIVVSAKSDGNALCLVVDNTYCGHLKKNKDGIYMSTKHKGIGIGIESVKSIAGQYDGIFHIEQQNDMFFASVLLQY